MHYNDFNLYYKKHIQNNYNKDKLLMNYLNDKEYVWANEDTLYCLKQEDSINKDDVELMKHYCQIYKDPEYNFNLEPHIYELANLAYFRLRRLGEDQTIILQNNYKQCLDTLNYLGKSNTNLPLFNSLMNKLGKEEISYLLLQFNSKGKLEGFHTTILNRDHSLDNHLYYWLFNTSSLTKKEKEAWNLTGKRTQNLINESYNLDKELKALGLKRFYREGLLKTLAFLWNLSKLEFITIDKTVTIKNLDLIGVMSEILLLDPEQFQQNLLMKNTTIRGEKCTLFYTRRQASDQIRLAREFLYGLIVDFIIQQVNLNNSLEEDFHSIGLLRLPQQQIERSELNQFCNLMLMEKYQNIIQYHDNGFNNINYTNSQQPTTCYLDPLIRFIDINTQPSTPTTLKGPSIGLGQKELKSIGDYYKTDQRITFNVNTNKVKDKVANINGELNTKFQIKYHDEIFDLNQLVEENKLDYQISLSMIELLLDSEVEFCKDILGLDKVNIIRQVQTTEQSCSIRIPSRPGSKRFTMNLENSMEEYEYLWSTNINIHLATFNETLSSIKGTYLFKILDFNPEALDKIINSTSNSYIVSYEGEEFQTRYMTTNKEQGIDNYMNQLGLINNNYLIAKTNEIYLDWYALFYLENLIRKTSQRTPEIAYEQAVGEYLFEASTDAKEQQMKELIQSWSTPQITQDTPSIFCAQSDSSSVQLDEVIIMDQGSPSSGYSTDGTLVKRPLTWNQKIEHRRVENKTTISRNLWLSYVYLTTFLLPDSLIRHLVKDSLNQKSSKEEGKKRILAYREKLALFLLILLSWSFILFINILLPYILCPSTNLISINELQTHSMNNPDKPKGIWSSLRGNVYNLDKLTHSDHTNGISAATKDHLEKLSGLDISYMFPIPPSAACPGLDVTIDGFLTVNYTDVSVKAEKLEQSPVVFVHDFGSPLSQYQAFYEDRPHLANEDWYKDNVLPNIKHIKRGDLVYSRDDLIELRKDNTGLVKIGEEIFDLSTYFYSLPYIPGLNFLNSKLVNLIAEFGDVDKKFDLTDRWNQLKIKNKKAEYQCMKNLFYRGKMDPRLTLKCTISNYLLYWSAWLILAIIFIKFLASLQFTLSTIPSEVLDKFVIIQIPCYTENEESIRKSIDSVVRTDYPNQQKVLFLVVDGMVIGHGNTKSTADILMDIFQPSNKNSAKPRWYPSLSSNEKLELNRAKVYSGLYSFEEQEVPYIIVTKIGNPIEILKPGNRGKRDSQCLIFNFFSKVYENQYRETLMNPLELDIYSHFHNHLGIDPHQFEFFVMLDADTELMKTSLTQLISTMIYDNNVLGVCGETKIENEHESLATMIQVYEYFVSHFLSKAFESLFGSVTCLPGCFSAYRLRSPLPISYKESGETNWISLPEKDRIIPYLISKEIIKEYSKVDQDTLHSKNLLSLGEDRYLSTLMLKNFKNGKLKFNPEAQCQTQAPNTLKMLVSQRRRWINSTIHNLIELVQLNSLCGCGIFNMRLVVLVDLIGTLLMPSMIVYLIYLFTYILQSSLYQEEDRTKQRFGLSTLSITTLLLMSLIYGTQIVMFVLRLRFKYFGWLLLHTLAVPFFHLFLPIYSFWFMDDFSWGNTRQISSSNQNKNEKFNVWNKELDDGVRSIKDIPKLSWLQFVNSDLYEPIFDDPIPINNKPWDSGDQFVYSDLTLHQQQDLVNLDTSSYMDGPRFVSNQMRFMDANLSTNQFIQQPEPAVMLNNNPFYSNESQLDLSNPGLYFSGEPFSPAVLPFSPIGSSPSLNNNRNTIGYHYSSPNLAIRSTQNLHQQRNTQSFTNFYPNYGSVNRKSFY